MTLQVNTSLTIEVPVSLRLAVLTDLSKLEWYGQYTHYRRLFRRTFREQESGHRLMLLAVTNDFPIGTVFIQFRSSERKVADGCTRAYLYSLRVMEMFRGKGIGTRLLQEAESLILDHGFQRATIAVAKDNLNARRLYERLGYAIFRDDPGHWSFVDHRGQVRRVNEPCWLLQKNLQLR
jgi:ribosomal protein S18 acetylase RimI-like enzyme